MYLDSNHETLTISVVDILIINLSECSRTFCDEHEWTCEIIYLHCSVTYIHVVVWDSSTEMSEPQSQNMQWTLGTTYLACHWPTCRCLLMSFSTSLRWASSQVLSFSRHCLHSSASFSSLSSTSLTTSTSLFTLLSSSDTYR